MVMFPFGGGLNGDDFGQSDKEYFNRPGNGGHYSYSNKVPFKPDKWYYHKKVKIEIITDTDKAYFVEDKNGKYWIPKKLLIFRKSGKIMQYLKFKVKYI